jgi:chromosomal replication initiator protein
VAAILWPRQVAIYIAREHSGASLATIAAAFGGRNHTTAINACRKVEQRIEDESDLATELRQLSDQMFKTSAGNSSDRAQ